MSYNYMYNPVVVQAAAVVADQPKSVCPLLIQYPLAESFPISQNDE